MECSFNWLKESINDLNSRVIKSAGAVLQPNCRPISAKNNPCSLAVSLLVSTVMCMHGSPEFLVLNLVTSTLASSPERAKNGEAPGTHCACV